MTLKGHREALSAVCWLRDGAQVVTASWDHTLRTWDIDTGALVSELCGNKSFFDLHVSPLSGMFITASADRHVRLYDPRSSGKFKVLLSKQNVLILCVKVQFW